MLVHCWSRVSHFFPQFPHLSMGILAQYLKDGRLEANPLGSISLKVHSSTFITAPNWKQPQFHQYGERAYGIFISWILFSCQSEQIIAVASTTQMHLWWTELCPPIPANSCVQVLYLSDVTIFGNRAFKEEVTLLRWVLIHATGVLIRGDEDADICRGTTTWGYREKMATYKPGREASGGTNPADSSTLGSWPLDLWESTGLLFKPLSSWYFTTEGLANKYRILQCWVTGIRHKN